MASADESAFSDVSVSARQLIVLAIIVAIGIFLVGQIAPSTGGAAVDGIHRISGGSVLLQDYGSERGAPTILDSTGRAVSLDGSPDAAVTASLGVDTQQAHYSVTTWTAVNGTDNQTIMQVGSGMAVSYRQDLDAWRLWVYNKSSANSYATTVPAPSEGSLTRLAVVRDNQTVTLYRNESASANVTLAPSGSSIAPAPSGTLQGTLEETRGWQETLTASERAATYNRPLRAVNSSRADARLMYDGTGSDIIVGFAGDGTLTSGSRTAGFAGQQMVRGNDYTLSLAGADLTISTAGRLTNMPQLVVRAPGGGGGTTLTVVLGQVFQVAAVVLVLIVGAAIVRVSREL